MVQVRRGGSSWAGGGRIDELGGPAGGRGARSLLELPRSGGGIFGIQHRDESGAAATNRKSSLEREPPRLGPPAGGQGCTNFTSGSDGG